MTKPPELPGHPEPHSFTWTRLEENAIREYGQKSYQAGLAAGQQGKGELQRCGICYGKCVELKG